jgi:hypothetical protein
MMHIMRRWNVVVPDDLGVRVDEFLDGRNLSAFVRRAVEQALATDRGSGEDARVSPPAVPAPAEQPKSTWSNVASDADFNKRAEPEHDGVPFAPAGDRLRETRRPRVGPKRDFTPRPKGGKS